MAYLYVPTFSQPSSNLLGRKTNPEIEAVKTCYKQHAVLLSRQYYRKKGDLVRNSGKSLVTDFFPSLELTSTIVNLEMPMNDWIKQVLNINNTQQLLMQR